MEAKSVTGPAKNLLGFGQWLLTAEGRKSGIELAIATYQRAGLDREPNGFIRAAQEAGIELHVIPELRRFDLGIVERTAAVIQGFDPCIVQTHNNKSHLLVRLLKRLRTDRRWIAFHHGEVHSDLKQRVYNNVDRLSLRHADLAVTVCAAFSRRLQSFGVAEGKVRILHNSVAATRVPVDTARDDWRGRLGATADTYLLVSVGRLSAEKGHGDLLRALAQRGARNWRLVLVGDGPERVSLLRESEALGISQNIIFTGFMNNVAELLSAADMFVLPSRSEGSSNALLEAMAAGLPIVATDAGGTPEIIENRRSGLVTPVQDVVALSGAISSLVADPSLAKALGTAARERAASEFSPAAYRRKLLAIYAECGSEVAAAGIQHEQ